MVDIAACVCVRQSTRRRRYTFWYAPSGSPCKARIARNKKNCKLCGRQDCGTRAVHISISFVKVSANQDVAHASRNFKYKLVVVEHV